ncbi:alpha/beta fold hydrolase [Phenylobacterium sp. 20VBR1]|uniref:Alpha/beta fold hydrolase n=1 Tax=Phenylobacterium glaciei TaxID=2803784 RepID=A0A941CXM9_9CAUL|nr:alpha/beta fold hydrolase [Phenylobacterium glaciei]MBR7618515.1 alpha/beta fold hydrolase [Phenylobacterium glaciei]
MLQVLTTGEGVPFLRSPEASFQGLADYPFAPRHILFEGLRLAYVDEGPRDGPVALLMHGMPTWSYLNRKIIHRLVAAGWRCVAADHIGFGRSDKVTDDRWYSIARHVAAHRLLIETLDLREVTLFCQDWGGPIGLAQAAEQPERFSRLVVMNTWLHHPAYAYTDALRQWNAQWQTDGLFGINVPEKLSLGWFMMLPLGHMKPADLFGIIATGTYPTLTAEQEAIRRGYDAPFVGLDRAGHAGPRRFPLSLPFDNPEGGAAEAQARWFDALLDWPKPIHFIWGGNDAVFTEDWGRAWAANYSQASFHLLPDAGHFLQDTHGEAIAEIVLEQMKAKQ